jgi:hypothetical protein
MNQFASDSHDLSLNPIAVPPVPVVVPSLPRVDERWVETRLGELEALARQLEEADYGPIEPTDDLDLPVDFLLSIVVPVYNEETTIRSIVAKLLQLDVPLEVIIVDDGSTDRTRHQLALRDGLPRLVSV